MRRRRRSLTASPPITRSGELVTSSSTRRVPRALPSVHRLLSAPSEGPQRALDALLASSWVVRLPTPLPPLRFRVYDAPSPPRRTPAGRLDVWSHLKALQLPEQGNPCRNRLTRRQVLFAKRIAGRRGITGRGGTYRRNLTSQFSCGA